MLGPSHNFPDLHSTDTYQQNPFTGPYILVQIRPYDLTRHGSLTRPNYLTYNGWPIHHWTVSPKMLILMFTGIHPPISIQQIIQGSAPQNYACESSVHRASVMHTSW